MLLLALHDAFSGLRHPNRSKWEKLENEKENNALQEELRRQRRAEEKTQDVVATSTVINDGLQGLEWSFGNGENVRIFALNLAFP